MAPEPTLEPTSNASAVTTRVRAPRSSFIRISLGLQIVAYRRRTFGHKYLDISLRIAQSAVRCSLFETVCLESGESVLGASSTLVAVSTDLLRISDLRVSEDAFP